LSEEQALFKRFSDEFKALEGKPFILETTAVHAWAIMTHIQLALRHPKNKGPTAAMAKEIAQKMIEVLAPPGTALREVADRGWNPKYDS
jgi:hypothetical protein